MDIVVMGHHVKINIQSAPTFTARNISSSLSAATLVTISVVHSHWSTVLLHQHSYAIKKQLMALKASA